MLLRSVQSSRFNAPKARFKWFNAATQRSKFKVQCCFAAFKIQREAQGPYTPKALHAPQALYTQLSGLTRCKAALPAALLPYTPKALHAAKQLYTRRRRFTRALAL